MSPATARRATAAGILVGIAMACAAGSGCSPGEPAAESRPQTIPLTTESETAREEFLAGETRLLLLHGEEAREHFLEAVEADPGFALGHLMLAQTSPSAQAFFDSLERAVELSKNASCAEQLVVKAAHAGALNDPAAQERNLKELVHTAPDDPRAHNMLGAFYFKQQRYDLALERFERATELDPTFSPPYNLMGYSYRALDRFEEAEEAYLKYIEVVPDEANPYDSLAEFLLKQGRFEDAIVYYREALERDPHFLPSHGGIANAYLFLGRPEEARRILDELLANARNDGERRQALLWISATYIAEDRFDEAAEALERRTELVAEAGDEATLANDRLSLGRLLLEAGDVEAASRAFDAALERAENAEVPDEVKERARRIQHYYLALVALERGQVARARKEAETFRDLAEPRQIPDEIRRMHEVLGRVLLAEGRHAEALDQFGRADQRKPEVILAMAQAARGAGRPQLALDLAERAANFNEPVYSYAFVRRPAQRLWQTLVAEAGGAERPIVADSARGQTPPP